jgi:hypothetical protein
MQNWAPGAYQKALNVGVRRFNPDTGGFETIPMPVSGAGILKQSLERGEFPQFINPDDAAAAGLSPYEVKNQLGYTYNADTGMWEFSELPEGGEGGPEVVGAGGGGGYGYGGYGRGGYGRGGGRASGIAMEEPQGQGGFALGRNYNVPFAPGELETPGGGFAPGGGGIRPVAYGGGGGLPPARYYSGAASAPTRGVTAGYGGAAAPVRGNLPAQVQQFPGRFGLVSWRI